MFLDFTQYDMGLFGGVVALVVFGIFISTWWWYGMRVTEARAREREALAAPVRAIAPTPTGAIRSTTREIEATG